jgi:hypothetical protein
MQYLSGYNKKVLCKPILEKQAYDLMDLWLEENNAKMPEKLAMGPLLRYTLTTCDLFTRGSWMMEEPK